ncbi:hypothetical protein SK571_13655 [Lentzea sp. BCCO 10_0798]|uniref:Uncharacterized protein n=1 Tax=Lentzea kristufekii TaxID=3095430 RepID=A0ABU4TQD1_9PSEU|nr:hypothetical protein [Lentzea sp. BCCO 10_0798]MDX8050432.1 hypothetical protein [Lentzea sp. BCCO 10_0798]
MTVPKWQEPLVAQAAAAEQTLRAVMHAPGGGAGAMAAAAAADQDLAELCRAVAARSGSPLLRQLLVHGARALDSHAGVLLAATIDPDELVVPAPPAVAEEQQTAPVEEQRTSDWDGSVWPPQRPFEDEQAEDQALVEQGSEPAETSVDTPANEVVTGGSEASVSPSCSYSPSCVNPPEDGYTACEEHVSLAALEEQEREHVAAAAATPAVQLRSLNEAYNEARSRYSNATNARTLALSTPPQAARAAADLVAILRRARDSGLFTGVALWAIEDATTLYELAVAGAS